MYLEYITKLSIKLKKRGSSEEMKQGNNQRKTNQTNLFATLQQGRFLQTIKNIYRYTRTK